LARLATEITKLICDRSYVSKICHEAREKAIHMEWSNRMQRLMQASTLKRALYPEVTERRKLLATHEAMKTWYSFPSHEMRSAMRITSLVSHYAVKAYRRGIEDQPVPNPPTVLPATKACSELKLADGGAMKQCYNALCGLKEIYTKSELWSEIYGLNKETSIHDFAMLLTGTTDISHAILTAASNASWMSPEDEMGREIHQLLAGFSMKEMEPVPIIDKGGKVRVITKHPALQVTLARHLMGTWVKILKRLGPSRAILAGQEPSLIRMRAEGTQMCYFYSADLSKATDLIPHEVAVMMAKKFCDGFFSSMTGGEPESHWLTRTLLQLLEEKEIVGDRLEKQMSTKGVSKHLIRRLTRYTTRPTSQGIHMGLGPTWVILSLLNIGCALQAGAPATSFVVCGDDLLGWWTEDTIRRYNQNIEKCGMKINAAKSFMSSSSGVFCEGAVQRSRSDRNSAKVVFIQKMGEKYSSEYRKYGRTKKEKFVTAVISAPKNGPLAKIIQSRPKGKPELGFGGSKKPTRKDLRQAFFRGTRPISQTVVQDEMSRILKECTVSTSVQGCIKGDIPIDKMMGFVTRCAKEQRALKHIGGEITKSFTKYVNGDMKTLSFERYKSMNPRNPKPPMPRRIRKLIAHRPWLAEEAIARYWSKNVLRTSTIPIDIVEGMTITLADGTPYTFADAKRGHLPNSFLKEEMHPILSAHNYTIGP
jgi:hypothetical protein